jgi:methionine-rich copper-binding protein CopC
MNKLRRAAMVLLVSAVLCLLLAGCYGHLRIGYVGSQRNRTMSARYTFCTETKSAKERLQEGEELELSYDVKVESGKVALAIFDPDGETVWSVELEEDAKDKAVVEAGEDGIYTVQIDLQATQGSYEVTWDKR